jgi:hypothetical protein
LGPGTSNNDLADIFSLSSSLERRFDSGSSSEYPMLLVMFAGWVMMVNDYVSLFSIGVCGASPTVRATSSTSDGHWGTDFASLVHV